MQLHPAFIGELRQRAPRVRLKLSVWYLSSMTAGDPDCILGLNTTPREYDLQDEIGNKSAT